MLLKKWSPMIALCLLSGLSQAGSANTDAILGGALGGAAGAAVGQAVGGRDGAMLGSAIGGATGVAVTTSRSEPEYRGGYHDGRRRHDRGHHYGWRHHHGR